ncbi:MAG: translation elongation factor Ts [Candidatus Eisenbacteria bacterium]|nr:translation elongation factor Ts [Candidatus Eisenbacteria bacterium]
MEINAQQVKALRERTGAGMMDCKKALQECNGDSDKAVDWLRKHGVAAAAKREGREAKEGLVYAYIHPGNRVGVLIEVNCETDFVARNAEFQEMVKNVAMHIAAASPIAVRREEISEETTAKEKEIFQAQAEATGKPAAVIQKIIEGRLEKFFAEQVLLEQPYVKEPKLTVGDVVDEVRAKIGENIRVRRFVRFELGEA